MATFAELALPLAQRGIPVIPVLPFSKRGFLDDQFRHATTDISEIAQWNRENPNFNVGCVCKPDAIVVLDCDVKGLTRRIENETGHKFPPTLVVRSAGKGCDHLYFLQTDVSRELGNQKRADLFDLQSVDKYVVGPGSRLDNGKTYEIVNDSPIADFPDWLEIWILANADLPKEHTNGNDGHPIDESFDIVDLLEHYGIGYHQDGEWYITDICPVAGRKHEQSTRTGFFFDGHGIGFHCFASGCEGSTMTVGQVIKFLNRDHEPYKGAIWEEEPIEDVLNFAEPADAMPESDVKTNGQDESYNLKGTPCPACHKELIMGAMDAECKSCLRKTAIKQTQAEGEIELASGTKDGGYVALNILEAHAVVTEELRWLWPLRVPAFKVTLFAGKGGCGKSTVVIDLVARVTTGRDWPDGSRNEWGAKRVLMAFTEDDASDTVVPKLIAAGADLTLVKIISMVSGIIEGKPFRRPFNLKEDMRLLEKALKENPDIALIALDPIASYYGDRDSNADKDMRPIFEGLQQLCARTQTAVVGIIHHNKKAELDAVQKIAGAGSTGNVTRAVWSFSRDPEKKKEYYMSSAKNNNAPDDLGGLKYSMVSVPVLLSNGREDLRPRIEWLGATDMDANEVDQKVKEAQREGSRDTKIEKMKLMLKAELEKGARLATDMYRMGEREFGVGTGKTLKRAQVEIGGLTTKIKPYYWYLPGLEPEGITATVAMGEDAQIPDTEAL